jgi:hypothetical protein
MGDEILVDEQIEAGADFVRDFDAYFPVSVAFWTIPADSDNLFLYIASDGINDRNVHDAYGEVLRRLSGKASSSLDPFQVKLISSSNPIARGAIQIRDRYPVKLPTRTNVSSIGGMGIEGACIYPPVSEMKSAS